MSERRKFSPALKARVVLEVISGKGNAEVCREYDLGAPLLSAWKAAFLERAALVFESDEQRSQEQARIAELERLVGRQALEIKVLKKATSFLSARPRRNGRCS